MHTQHVKFSTYVAWCGGVGGVVAVGVVFEEGEISGLVEDDDRSVLEVVVVVFFFLPSPSLLLASFLLDFIDTIVTGCSSLMVLMVSFYDEKNVKTRNK
jgi:hypothetical protein